MHQDLQPDMTALCSLVTTSRSRSSRQLQTRTETATKPMLALGLKETALRDANTLGQTLITSLLCHQTVLLPGLCLLKSLNGLTVEESTWESASIALRNPSFLTQTTQQTLPQHPHHYPLICFKVRLSPHSTRTLHRVAITSAFLAQPSNQRVASF